MTLCPVEFLHADEPSYPPYYGNWMQSVIALLPVETMQLLGDQARETFLSLGFADPTERIEWLINHKRTDAGEIYYVSAWRVQP